ncbi:DUF4357 domain-containing protein [Microbacterium sp. APC 3898]|uniref:DUF4357 domain-containing protein n=1 Tax=Planococcus notacanthi TaxID=3035188 RepID=A0ABT7ZJW7_9BACL|nr:MULTISPECIES: DUF4357 domain-containing protein [Terrabacteria group]MDN3427446.1 DUF4357 domain-containing protein [Planococcus sp. APC 4016]MDN3498997.1 DUF4357 domain-containing protein [Microbacterium sp. APC 3898]
MKEYYLKKIQHPQEGELYQFLELDTETGEEQAIDPFESGMLQLHAETEPEVEIFSITSKRGADATGFYRGEKFVVQRGSKFAASTSPKCPKKYVKLRENLVLDKLLIPFEHQFLLMEDTEFTSPMMAMGAVIGGWVRGSHDWKEAKGK